MTKKLHILNQIIGYGLIGTIGAIVAYYMPLPKLHYSVPRMSVPVTFLILYAFCVVNLTLKSKNHKLQNNRIMANSREEAFRQYRRTGRNNSEYDLNDYDDIAARTGWKCARNEGRAEAFRNYHRTGVNHSKYDLNDRDEINSIIRNK